MAEVQKQSNYKKINSTVNKIHQNNAQTTQISQPLVASLKYYLHNSIFMRIFAI